MILKEKHVIFRILILLHSLKVINLSGNCAIARWPCFSLYENLPFVFDQKVSSLLPIGKLLQCKDGKMCYSKENATYKEFILHEDKLHVP